MNITDDNINTCPDAPSEERKPIHWDRCTNRDEILSQYTEEEFWKLVTYGVQNEPEKFRFVKFGDTYAPIDEDIADLITDLNSAGYKTMYCCCGHYQRKKPGDSENTVPRKSSYYISFVYNEKNLDLVRRLNDLILLNPLHPQIWEVAKRGCLRTSEIKHVFKLKDDAKKHISMYHCSSAWGRPGIYMYWRVKDDIKWINDTIKSVM